MVRVVNFESEQELFAWAARDFVAKARVALKNKSYFDVALSGGSTAQNYFAILAKTLHDLPFLNHLRFFVSDERVVDLSHQESNAGNAWRKLLMPLGLRESQIISLYDSCGSPEEAAARYEKILKNFFQEPIPALDIIYLGIGQDGHTASIFPYSSLVKNQSTDKRLVASSEEEILGYRRLTFMPALINAAKNICVMAPKKSKAQIIDEILTGPLDPLKLPAQLVMRTNNENVYVLRSAD